MLSTISLGAFSFYLILNSMCYYLPAFQFKYFNLFDIKFFV